MTFYLRVFFADVRSQTTKHAKKTISFVSFASFVFFVDIRSQTTKHTKNTKNTKKYDPEFPDCHRLGNVTKLLIRYLTAISDISALLGLNF